MEINKKEKINKTRLMGYIFLVAVFLGIFLLSSGGDGKWGIPISVLIYLFIIAPAYVIYLLIANISSFSKKEGRRKTLVIINLPLVIVCIVGVLGYLSDLRPLNKATFKITNEAGVPIEGAQILMRFSDNRKSYETDAAGLATVMGFGFGLSGWVKKEGYYQQEVRYSAKAPERTVKIIWRFKYNLPWNPTVTIALEKIHNPIKLHKKIVGYDSSTDGNIPADKAGYDLVIGDWVVPFGKGKYSDVIFELVPAPETRHGRVRFRFGNKNDGLISLKSENKPFFSR